jgi:hypothetical protein
MLFRSVQPNQWKRRRYSSCFNVLLVIENHDADFDILKIPLVSRIGSRLKKNATILPQWVDAAEIMHPPTAAGALLS